MDNFLPQQESSTQELIGLSARRHLFDGILNWLAGLIQITEEEQDEAGIYIGDPESNNKEIT